MTFQDLLGTLSNFWAAHGCAVMQPYELETLPRARTVEYSICATV